MKELFNRIDTDGSNNLDLQESILFFKSITDDISDENIEKIFSSLDADGKKSINFNEFTVVNISDDISHSIMSPELVQHNISSWVEPGSADPEAQDPGGGSAGTVQHDRHGQERLPGYEGEAYSTVVL